MVLNHIPVNDKKKLFFIGPDRDVGPLPALFYFAISGKDSLTKDPFNQPALYAQEKSVRIFSLDLPFHTEKDDPTHALKKWGKELEHSDHLISSFIQEIKESIQVLQENKLLETGKLGAMGLSRGGFIATHAAAAIPEIKAVVGFSPLCKLSKAQDFMETPVTASLDLIHTVNHLIGKPFKFYIGNCDTRVGTRFAFEFIEHLSLASTSHGIRSPLVEMNIFPSIGYQGHGTPPHIFKEGALWLLNHVLS